MLSDEIKARMMAAMKAKKVVEKEVLSVALGEIQTEQARSGEAMKDDGVEKILRKLVKSNRETIAVTEDEARATTLTEEVAILEALLPQTLDESQIIAALAPVAEDIKAAAADGPATGVAMKHLKSEGAAVDGKTVALAVKKMRA
ncbi:MAG: hypothetical protein DRI90_20785 [Deltaproteobacteria bacterium]|nr:MAG: hypothetical protein DRI90_20785 [Deltaproteobacteria bacterium]